MSVGRVIHHLAVWLALAMLLLVARTWLFCQTLEIRSKNSSGNIGEYSFDTSAFDDIDRIEAAERLAKIIRIPSVSYGRGKFADVKHFKSIHKELEILFPAAHKAMKRTIVNQYSLMYEWQGKDTSLQPLVLISHIDVVPAPDSKDWTCGSAFSGCLQDGFVYGRGTLDVKVSLLAQLEAVEFMAKQGHVPRRSIIIVSGHDEEVGGADGAMEIVSVLKNRGIRPWAIIDEGGFVGSGVVPFVKAPVALVGTAEKGMVRVLLTANNTGSAHASIATLPSPAGRIGQALHALENWRANPNSKFFRNLLAPLALHLPWPVGFAAVNADLFQPLLVKALESKGTMNAYMRSTCVGTMLQGSEKKNVVPSTASAMVDCRILPGDTVNSVVSYVRSVLPAGVDAKIDIEELFLEPAPVTNSDSNEFAWLKQVIGQVFPDALVSPYLMVGGTDSRHFTDLTENIFRFLPVRMTQKEVDLLHNTNERISIHSYMETIMFFVVAMARA